jgi:putative colanic acid biosysnthesis UDP-glucose lipid carrier transferase
VFKLIFDKIVSFLILLFLSPVLIIIATATFFVDGLPITYSARRVGFKGKIFYIYKFRSMTRNSSRVLGTWGLFIRKTNLDELLQFVNVIKGDMSIIGPRPHDELEDIYFNDHIEQYHLRRQVRPGITGLSAIRGNRGGTDLDIIRQRVEYDLEYIKNKNFFLDIKIFIKTIVIVFKPNH